MDVFVQPIVMLLICSGLAVGIFLASRRYSAKKRERGIVWQRFIEYGNKLAFSGGLISAVIVYIIAANNYANPTLSLTFMARVYGLCALFGLFLAVGIRLSSGYFSGSPLAVVLLHSSRGIGLAVFLFACFHALSAFFGNLGGKIDAVAYFSARYQLALLFSGISFLILIVMTALRLDGFVKKIRFLGWRPLRASLHIIVFLSILHAFMIGSHFAETNAVLGTIVKYLAMMFVLLEAGLIYRNIQSGHDRLTERQTNFAYALLVAMLAIGLFAAVYSSKPSDPHAEHHTAVHSQNYSLKVTQDKNMYAGEPASFRIEVVNMVSGNVATDFLISSEELIHVVVVSEDLKQYEHLHPTYVGHGTFNASFTPLTEATYYLYADFITEEYGESLAASKIRTAVAPEEGFLVLEDERKTASAGSYTVELVADQPMRAGKDYEFQFEISKGAERVTELEPYLGSAGHLVILHADKQTYVHAHPLRTESIDGGKFKNSPFGVQFPRPGKYKIFFQFKDQNVLRLVSYVVEVQ